MDEENNQTEENIEQLKADLAAAQDSWKRSLADFENFRRRKEEENKELVQFAREVAVAKLLPTLDSLEQGLRHSPDSNAEDFKAKYENWMVGIKGILIQLDVALSELGVKKIEAVGKKFDPHYHEAVREVEGAEDGMVVEELQTGFELNGKVIRPSQVVISKKA